MPLDVEVTNADAQEDAILALLTLHLSPPIYVTFNPTNVVSQGRTFLAARCEIVQPDDDGEPIEVEISIPNVSMGIAGLIETTDEPVSATLELVVSSDLDNPYKTYTGLKLSSAGLDMTTASWKFRGALPIDEPVVDVRVTPDRFPGVYHSFV